MLLWISRWPSQDKQFTSLACPFLVDDQQPETKVEQAPVLVKKEAPLMAETKALDGTPPISTSGKKKNYAKKQKTESGKDDAVIPQTQLLLSFLK